jgi:hypothetical protein
MPRSKRYIVLESIYECACCSRHSQGNWIPARADKEFDFVQWRANLRILSGFSNQCSAHSNPPAEVISSVAAVCVCAAPPNKIAPRRWRRRSRRGCLLRSFRSQEEAGVAAGAPRTLLSPALRGARPSAYPPMGPRLCSPPPPPLMPSTGQQVGRTLTIALNTNP